MITEQIPLLNQLAPEVRETILRILLAIFALLLAWLLRRMITRRIIGPFRRLAARTKTTWDNQLLDIIERPLQYLVLALGFSVAVSILQVDRSANTFINQLIRSLIIIAIAVGVFRVVDLVSLSSKQLHTITGITIEERLMPFLRAGLRLFIIVIAATIIIQEFGYDVSGLIAGLGLGGLAFSLAAKDTVENLFGFAVIVTDKPFNVGDFIIVSDTVGIVEYVGLRSTVIRQLDQARVTVPNSKMASAVLTNWSHLSKRRINFTVGLTYGTTNQQMRAFLERVREMLKANPKVDPDSVIVLFTEFGESSLNVLIRGYMGLPDWRDFMGEMEAINLRIMELIDEMGLSIAFPSRSLYIERAPASDLLPLSQRSVDSLRTAEPDQPIPPQGPDTPAGDPHEP